MKTKNIFIYLFYLCIFSVRTLQGDLSNQLILNVQSESVLSTESKSQQKSIEFLFKNIELQEMSKWKEKTLEEMRKDAFECDRAALYMLGMGFITGSMDLTIDVEIADFCFSRSASLGFAPSIKQLIHKNIENENVALCLVYTNLLASLGHQEYVIPYHELRSKFLNTCGSDVVKEIEKIAFKKKKLIFNNIKTLESEKDKKSFFKSMKTNKKLIDQEDKNLDENYWVKFSKFQREAEENASKFDQAVLNNFTNLHSFYLESRKNLQFALECYENNENFCSRNAAIKNAIQAIDFADKFIEAMESLKNVPNDNLRKIVHEFLNLSINIKTALDLHYKFFQSPSNFLSSDENVSRLSDACARIEIYNANIKNILEKLKKQIAYF